MYWDDLGFYYQKTDITKIVIAEIFTENNGKCSGVIFGATSKIKSYLQIGNKFHVNYNYKNDNKLGYFKIEILKAFTPIYFDNKNKLLCISSALNLNKIINSRVHKKIIKYLI